MPVLIFTVRMRAVLVYSHSPHKALSSKGVKGLCNYEHRFDNTYLFGAFSPLNGNHLILEMPLV